MLDDRPLLVDRSAATTPPEDADVRTWAADQRVFVSSTITDLAEDRAAAKRGIESIGAVPVLFEEFGARDADPENAYISEVDASTIYLGLLGERYGRPDAATRFSATHAEFRRAEERGLRIAVWAKEVAREGPQQSFLQEIQVFRTTQAYGAADELEGLVQSRLRQIAAEEIAPWVKLGHIIFRATEVSEGSGRIAARGRVRDGGVLAALREIGDDRFRGYTGQLTWAGRSRGVRIETVDITTVTANQHRIAMTFEDRGTGSSKQATSLVSGTGSYTAQDITAIAIKSALFGEANPLGTMAFMSEVDNPLPAIASLRLSEEVIRPVLHLFLTEQLVGTGRIARVTSLILGPAVSGRRRLRLGWEEPRHFVNVTPGFNTVEGVVDLP